MKKIRISFRCFYPTNKVTHYQEITLKEIAKWIEAYQYTHPDCEAISVRVRLKETADTYSDED